MPNSTILGSDMKFDLRSLPFSTKGTYMSIFEDSTDRSLYLSITRSPTPKLERKNLIKLAPINDSNELQYEYEVQPGKLIIKTYKGSIEICFASENQLRVRGEGIGLRLSFKTLIYENLSPKEDGSYEMAYSILGKLLFVPIKGGLWSGAKWVPAKAMVEDFNMEFLPSSETNELEIAIQEYYTNGVREQSYAPFDECVSAAEKRFKAFYKLFPKPKGENSKYSEMAELAAWTIWTHTIESGGNVKSPVVYMSRLSSIRAFAWQQSYVAMALSGNMSEALKFLMNMFDYQNEAGQLPESVGEIGISYRVSQPIIQGFSLLYLLDEGDITALSNKELQDLYEKLSRFTDWWLVKRDHEGSGVPKYYYPDESGWNDATIFKKGVPLMSADLLAWLVLATEACGKLADKLGMKDVVGKWTTESKRLLDFLVKDYWNGEQFISQVAGKNNRVVEEDSIVAMLPIILGKRLPAKIIDVIAEQLGEQGDFMTSGGIVSEKLGSPEFKGRNAFMRGNIVAPVQLLLAFGLKNAGKTELARNIAASYCNLVCEKGLSHTLLPYGYDPSTGLTMKEQDIYDPEDRKNKPDLFKKEKKEPETIEEWSSWAAACFLGILSGVLDKKDK